MKKILLSLAAVAMATAAYAQGPNLVVNGSFEDAGVEASVPGGYTWDPWNTYENIDVLPGWTLSTGGKQSPETAMHVPRMTHTISA